MSRRRGLGRGLAELIPVAEPPREGELVQDISLGLIEPNPFQPRRDFDPQLLAELAASIQAQGLLQPIIVRPLADGRYQVVAGERRLRATRDLGHTTIHAIAREVNDQQLLELSLVENLLRQDLNDMEVAEALNQLQNSYGYTTTQLAETWEVAPGRQQHLAPAGTTLGGPGPGPQPEAGRRARPGRAQLPGRNARGCGRAVRDRGSQCPRAGAQVQRAQHEAAGQASPGAPVADAVGADRAQAGRRAADGAPGHARADQ